MLFGWHGVLGHIRCFFIAVPRRAVPFCSGSGVVLDIWRLPHLVNDLYVGENMHCGTDHKSTLGASGRAWRGAYSAGFCTLWASRGLGKQVSGVQSAQRLGL